MSESEQKRICTQSDCAVRDELRSQITIKDARISELKEEIKEWKKATGVMESIINELEAGEDWFKNRHKEQQATIKTNEARISELESNLLEAAKCCDIKAEYEHYISIASKT